jgi:NADH-quinone oxidoreductase subunit F
VEIPDEKSPLHEAVGLALEEETSDDQPRIHVELEESTVRIKDFREVEKGFSSKEQARQEALRCLRCDLEKENE